MKVLITGVNGQTGSYLAEFYLKKGWEVYGTVRQRSNLKFVDKIENQLRLDVQDIRDPHGVMNLIRKIQPNIIHHLAAMTFVPYSWLNPLDTCETNIQGTINILEAARNIKDITVHFAGSSEEYGAVPLDQVPINEHTTIHPASPYGISKYTGDLFCQQYNRSYGLRTIITRAFNHTSPRRGNEFLTMQVAKQGLRIKEGLQSNFILGNLEAVRDFSDARDIVQAYYLAVTNSGVKAGVPYNICSEIGHSAQQVVDLVCRILGISPTIVQDPQRMRPSDCPSLLGSSRKFREATGWAPEHKLDDTFHWILETMAPWIKGGGEN